MARKIKIKIDKKKKKNIDDLYNFYINSLDDISRRKLDKEMLNKIYKAITHYNENKFKYLAFDTIIVSIAKIEEYLKKDVVFSEKIGFERYLKLSENLAKEIAYDFDSEVLNEGILEIMSDNFFSWAIKNKEEVESIKTDLTEDDLYKIDNFQKFYKEILIKRNQKNIKFSNKEEMVLVTLKNKKNDSLKYLEIREMDFEFLQNMFKVLKVMNLILKTSYIMEEEIEFVEKYKTCVYSLQRIIDYIYYKEILSTSYNFIPNHILRYI